MRTVFAIDPGPERSAWLRLVNQLVWAGGVHQRAAHVEGVPGRFGITQNAELLVAMRLLDPEDVDVVVIEQMQGFGMAVGAEVFETVRWAGRFEEAAWPIPVEMMPRKTVKVALCGTTQAKDPNVRQALIDRYGGPTSTRKGGILYGIGKDVWSALAIATVYADGLNIPP